MHINELKTISITDPAVAILVISIMIRPSGTYCELPAVLGEEIWAILVDND